MRIFKHSILSVLMVLACAATSLGQYSLTVTEEPAVATVGQTTYSFYVNMQDATDRLSAVFGNNITPLEVNAPDGVFNTSYNASWSASSAFSSREKWRPVNHARLLPLNFLNAIKFILFESLVII